MEKPLNLRKVMLYILIFSLVLSAGVGIFILLRGEFGETEGKVLATAASLGIFTIFGLSCSVLYDKGRLRGLAMSGIILAALSFVVLLFPLWGNKDVLEDYWRHAFSVAVVAFTVAHSCLLLLIVPERPSVRWMLRLTLLFNALFCGLLIILIMIEFDVENDIWIRLWGVFTILSVLGTVVTPLVHKFIHKPEPREPEIKA